MPRRCNAIYRRRFCDVVAIPTAVADGGDSEGGETLPPFGNGRPRGGAVLLAVPGLSAISVRP
jgi:hypothetical protein